MQAYSVPQIRAIHNSNFQFGDMWHIWIEIFIFIGQVGIGKIRYCL